ncbi:hypothetical protein Q5P01_025365 [Channa striata]|uniref:Uncharacterized protein n=1 Tax=Channa striata TaxID=64152 RepID=A0AA88J5F4_CHASR|nr:hypothetical protein Q5P01_025365 [Channa striata]
MAQQNQQLLLFGYYRLVQSEVSGYDFNKLISQCKPGEPPSADTPLPPSSLPSPFIHSSALLCCTTLPRLSGPVQSGMELTMRGPFSASFTFPKNRASLMHKSQPRLSDTDAPSAPRGTGHNASPEELGHSHW